MGARPPREDTTTSTTGSMRGPPHFREALSFNRCRILLVGPASHVGNRLIGRADRWTWQRRVANFANRAGRPGPGYSGGPTFRLAAFPSRAPPAVVPSGVTKILCRWESRCRTSFRRGGGRGRPHVDLWRGIYFPRGIHPLPFSARFSCARRTRFIGRRSDGHVASASFKIWRCLHRPSKSVDPRSQLWSCPRP